LQNQLHNQLIESTAFHFLISFFTLCRAYTSHPSTIPYPVDSFSIELSCILVLSVTVMANLTTIHGGNTTLLLDHELCTLKTCDLSLAHLTYLPSVWGNAVFVGLFGLAIPIQIFLGVKYKTWGFTLAMFLGLALEVVGYVTRIMLHDSPFIKNNFILYLIFLTIAPAFISAGIYLCLSRIVILFGSGLSRLNARTYTILFCTSDLISLILQGAGGALASVGETTEDVRSSTPKLFMFNANTDRLTLALML